MLLYVQMDHNIPRNIREMETFEKEQMEIEVRTWWLACIINSLCGKDIDCDLQDLVMHAH